MFVQWCTNNDLPLFEVRRAHLEIFGRQMEADGRMRSTVARRLSTLGSFYRYCHVEGILERNPTANVRRPKVDVESRTLGLDRNELVALLVQAGLGSERDHALISLLALNGLRIREALGADVESMDIDCGHRTLAIVRKGGKHVIIPLARRTARTLDLYLGERTSGPIFLGVNGQRMDRYAGDRTVKRLAKRAGITKRISPHSLREPDGSLWLWGADYGVEPSQVLGNVAVATGGTTDTLALLRDGTLMQWRLGARPQVVRLPD